jgi:hypothetical protein
MCGQGKAGPLGTPAPGPTSVLKPRWGGTIRDPEREALRPKKYVEQGKAGLKDDFRGRCVVCVCVCGVCVCVCGVCVCVCVCVCVFSHTYAQTA